MLNNSKYFKIGGQDGSPNIIDRQFKVTRRFAKHPKVGFWDKRALIFEGSLIATLLLFITLALTFRDYEKGDLPEVVPDLALMIEDIPETKQLIKPPPPAVPAVPVESEDEDLMASITIEDTNILDFSNFEVPPPPPPLEEEEVPQFMVLADRPKIIGGLTALQKLVEYPLIARKAGIEGLVAISVQVDKEGNPVDFKILKSLGKAGLDEAAIEAIKKIKFTPGKQRGHVVKCWVNIRF